MEGEQILGQLNEPQKEAVTSGRQPVLVVAGAGSGKTRVLVHKIAWLIGVESISPHSILAVTFTNKAANEMNNRIRDMLNIDTRGMWVGTFHGLAHKFLRLHWQEAGLQQNFQILDSDDQHRQIKRLVKNMSLDEAYYPPKEIQWYINTQKDQGFRSSQSQTDPSRKDFTEIYKAYEEVCEQSGLVDFGELLLRCFEVLASKKELLEHYQSRFRHILVDEFQDTNEIQYQWIKLLSGNDTATFVVGDDDQSIYKWRGANSANMARFQKDYQGSRLIKLEQNYRSTKTILDAANAIIKNNDDRMEKKLWTDAEEGPLIKLHGNYDEYEESRNIIETILARSKKIALDDIAILYRSNAQSRVIEEALLQHSIPYRVYGGFRFFDRAEVKDVLAYLRIVVNNNDNIAFERAANMPPKGIGAKTMGEIRELSKKENISMFAAASQMIQHSLLSSRAQKSVMEYLHQIKNIKSSIENQDLSIQFEKCIELSGLISYLKKKKTEKSETKIDNISELVNAAYGYRPLLEEEEMTPLESFLSHAALESTDNQAAEFQECVQLMTMHSAKGLEFNMVFIAGMEDGLFPHQRSQLDPGGLQEERRLCYVAITRSMEKLYISYAGQRMLHGQTNYSQPSRFLMEIPDALIDDTSSNGVALSRPYFKKQIKQKNKSGMRLGQRVSHSRFGEGIVLALEGDGDNARAQINFEYEGIKWLVLGYAKLKLM